MCSVGRSVPRSVGRFVGAEAGASVGAQLRERLRAAVRFYYGSRTMERPKDHRIVRQQRPFTSANFALVGTSANPPA